jgi:hypothetical protein
VILGPLRWRVIADTVRDERDVLHRPGCPRAHDGERLAAGEVIERMWAPRCCHRCYPRVEMLLGPLGPTPHDRS